MSDHFKPYDVELLERAVDTIFWCQCRLEDLERPEELRVVKDLESRMTYMAKRAAAREIILEELRFSFQKTEKTKTNEKNNI